ncbi:uncharacterized protein LOC143366670 [Andrena cerasifolii]|uniref:uncharacterized protein LOC143366670 n=1 Tax=Andrena cerasifolii TaxID=2819439 RepID=UPI004037B02B
MAEQGSAVSEPSAPSFEALFKKIMESSMNRVPSTSTTTPAHVAEAIPEFGGVDIGDNAEKWCDIVKKATETLPLTQRLNLETHALTGSAKTWYASWHGHPRTWQKFREDICAEFISGARLCELLVRAVTYTSDGARSSSEYLRHKLKYYEQRGIEVKSKELISLVIGHVVDPTARQSLTNASYQMTVALKSGISQFQLGKRDKDSDKRPHHASRKQDDRNRKDDRKHKDDNDRKRCFTCNEVGHLQFENVNSSKPM